MNQLSSFVRTHQENQSAEVTCLILGFSEYPELQVPHCAGESGHDCDHQDQSRNPYPLCHTSSAPHPLLICVSLQWLHHGLLEYHRLGGL